MTHAYPDGTPIVRGDRVVWLRPQYQGAPKPVEAVVEKCDGGQIGVRIRVDGAWVQRCARAEHLRRDA